ncbi:MAG: cardiolipin synthase [Planctomycetota bacterium]|jgi:cardiolipin synthase
MWNVAFTILGGVIHIGAIAAVLIEERRRPSATLAWLLAIVFLPFVGVLLYFVIGRMRASRVATRRERAAGRIRQVLEKHSVRAALEAGAHPELEPRTASLLKLGRRLSTTPASHGNRAEILVDGEAAYRSMTEAIAAATDHVHVEFYIIEPDEVGTRLRDRLVARARDGVEVRVLTDAIGTRLPFGFWDPLLEAGGRAAVFEPVISPWRRRRHYRVDFRNHRKIVIVDGRTGFTGGINVGKEYLGRDPTLGEWRDTHVRLEGPAALSLQTTFAEDWYSATGDLLDAARYFPAVAGTGTAVVEVVDSGPDRTWSPISYVYSQAIALARERVWITSPYFVPGPHLEQTLIGAALRDVDVRLLLPGVSDSWLVQQTARSYYRRFLEAGVRIFEYQRGFVHSKTMAVDSWIGTVGSANMDTRSFQLNFELNAFVYGDQFADELAEDFLADQKHAREVDLADALNVRYPTRLVRSVARLLSPLL